ADLAVWGGTAVAVFLGDANGNFSSSPVIHYFGSVAPAHNGLRVGEFDGDANLDLSLASSGEALGLKGDGHGDFTEQSPIFFGQQYAPDDGVSADFNGDHSSDLYLTMADASTRVLMGDGAAHFTDGGSVNVQVRVRAYPILQAADFDNNGSPDVVTVDSSG